MYANTDERWGRRYACPLASSPSAVHAVPCKESVCMRSHPSNSSEGMVKPPSSDGSDTIALSEPSTYGLGFSVRVGIVAKSSLK